MKPINIYPIEDFIEKVRIATKTNQKNLVLNQKEYTELANSLALVMTRLAGILDANSKVREPENIQIKMDGGKF